MHFSLKARLMRSRRVGIFILAKGNISLLVNNYFPRMHSWSLLYWGFVASFSLLCAFDGTDSCCFHQHHNLFYH